MNSTIAIIVSASAIAGLFYFSQLRKLNKGAQEQIDYFLKTHSNIPPTEAQKRMLVFGAILSRYRLEHILDVIPNGRIDNIINSLKHQWGIYDRETALSTMAGLFVLNRSTSIDEILQINGVEERTVRAKIAEALDEDITKIQSVNSSYAWDLCCLVGLAKWCYWCGYISEQEMWHQMKPATDKAAALGTDWKEYTISFLLGRTIQGFNLDNISLGTKQLYHSKAKPSGKNKDMDVYLRYNFKS